MEIQMDKIKLLRSKADILETKINRLIYDFEQINKGCLVAIKRESGRECVILCIDIDTAV